jgi:Skp family chaperone for outer membrane proteins
MKRYSLTCLAVVLGCTLLLTGCEPQGSNRIAVGKVDTAQLLQDDPDYQSMSVTYLREQTDVRKEFVDQMKAAGKDEAKIKALQEKYAGVSQEFDEKWKKKTEEFLNTRHDSIQATAAEIAKRKKIDIVLIDSAMYPTVEWGGVDMTKDMALAMSDGSQHKPKATGTPSGDEG